LEKNHPHTTLSCAEANGERLLNVTKEIRAKTLPSSGFVDNPIVDARINAQEQVQNLFTRDSVAILRLNKPGLEQICVLTLTSFFNERAQVPVPSTF